MLLPSAAGDILQLDVPIRLTRAPAVFQVCGGPGEHTGCATFHVGLARSVYAAIQNREDDEIHIRVLGGGKQGETVEWTGRIEDVYTKKGPPRSYAVLTALFDETESTEMMMRIMAIVIGLRRTHQLNTPKFGFSLVIWSRLPKGEGYANTVSYSTAIAMAFKASTGLDKKRIDGVRVARAVVHGAKEVLGEKLSMAQALTAALCEMNSGMFIEHGLDPTMHWAPVPEHTFVAAVDLGLPPVAGPELVTAGGVGAAMGMVHLNKHLTAENQTTFGGWGQVTTKEFEGGLRGHVPARESGKDWLAKFAEEEPEVAELVDPNRPYRERALSEHQMRESGRVRRFVEQLSEYARTKREDHLAEAGKVMGSSHRSLKDKCSIHNEAVKDFMDRVNGAGRNAGLFGCRLAGAGEGSIVAVLCHNAGEEKLREILAGFSKDYEDQQVHRAGILTDTTRGSAMVGWWEGVLVPKEDKGPKPKDKPVPAE
jgi:galactokinase